MKNISDSGFEEALGGNFAVAAILAYSGISGDEGTLFVLDPNIIKEFDDFLENIKILYQFSKLSEKSFGAWQGALVDLNFNNTGEIAVLSKWQKPIVWKREIIYCSPNKRIEM